MDQEVGGSTPPSCTIYLIVLFGDFLNLFSLGGARDWAGKHRGSARFEFQGRADGRPLLPHHPKLRAERLVWGRAVADRERGEGQRDLGLCASSEPLRRRADERRRQLREHVAGEAC